MIVEGNRIYFSGNGTDYEAWVHRKKDGYFDIQITREPENHTITTLSSRLGDDLDILENYISKAQKILMYWLLEDEIRKYDMSIDDFFRTIDDKVVELDYAMIDSGLDIYVTFLDGTRKTIKFRNDKTVDVCPTKEDYITEEELKKYQKHHHYMAAVEDFIKITLEEKTKTKAKGKGIWERCEDKYNLSKDTHKFDYNSLKILKGEEPVVKPNEEIINEFIEHAAEEIASKNMFNMVYGLMKGKEIEQTKMLLELENKYGEFESIDKKTGKIRRG